MRQLILNAAALKHNFQQVRRFSPTAKIISMVKANAYGHGLVWGAQQLLSAGSEALGVATLDEAAILRNAGIQATIFLMDGFVNLAELKEAFALNLILVLHDESHIRYLETMTLPSAIPVWIKMDTGMHRLGFAPEKVFSVYQRLQALASIQKPIGVMTHFSDADDLTKTKTLEQIQRFQRITQPLQGCMKSAANSAGILAWPQASFDWVRPGIMLYGVSPLDQTYPLQPVMTVTSQVIGIESYETGAKIGYSETYTCPKSTRIAVVAFGYGDGYPRQVKGAEVLIKGQQCSVIGCVSMDLLQVDITAHENIQLGDEVILWGEGLSVKHLAAAAQTIPYEIFCRLQQHRMKVKFLSDAVN